MSKDQKVVKEPIITSSKPKIEGNEYEGPF